MLTVSAAPRNRGGAVSLIGAFKFSGNALAPVALIPLYDIDHRLAFAAAAVACVALAGVVSRAAG